jgi:hypothetical protein
MTLGGELLLEGIQLSELWKALGVQALRPLRGTVNATLSFQNVGEPTRSGSGRCPSAACAGRGPIWPGACRASSAWIGGCRVVLPICYREIVQLGDTATNYQLVPGDRIFVATRGLCEGLFEKPECPPCGGPHQACPTTPGQDKIAPPGPPLAAPSPAPEMLPEPRERKPAQEDRSPDTAASGKALPAKPSPAVPPPRNALSRLPIP